MTERTRRKFEREFKTETARLAVERGRRVSDFSRDLDIHENVLRNGGSSILRIRKEPFPGKDI
ncbi:MAG: Transposase [Syntrophorhabdus sp. PtaU1.Bin002]|nr:MAG: Transposase [Syntrophorhabdus sp. PtaU1.Bin002]